MAEGKTYNYTILPESEESEICSPLRETHDRPHLKASTWRTQALYLAISILLNALLVALFLYQNLHHSLQNNKAHYKISNGQGVSPYSNVPAHQMIPIPASNTSIQ